MSIVIAAAGTGGHVFPALAVAQKIRQEAPQVPIYFIGRKYGKEKTWIQNAGFLYEPLPIRGLARKKLLHNLPLMWEFPYSLVKAYTLLRRYKARVVFTTGGYVGLPVGYAARRCPVYVLEANAYAGLTSRLLEKKAQGFFAGHPAGIVNLSHAPIQYTGIPIRWETLPTRTQAHAFWKLDSEKLTVLILGGSLGAAALNAYAPQWIEKFPSCQWIWVYGSQDFPATYHPRLRAVPFEEKIEYAYAAADIVISRAGGSTLAEILSAAKPALLIPSPNVTDDHQRINARLLAEKGAALWAEENDTEKIMSMLTQLIQDSCLRQQLAEKASAHAMPGASKTIAQILLSHV
ncbi:MAG: UDP-N-acetylglucosamine--N-acetylmuramyl-(pentapeptide) pyrophosphoryl-undecaprenol N-acetylglucosamine transferase [Bacteroidia bacterium]